MKTRGAMIRNRIKLMIRIVICGMYFTIAGGK